jgi:hypothetical protein
MIDVLLYNLQQSMHRIQISYGISIFHWKFFGLLFDIAVLVLFKRAAWKIICIYLLI